MKPQVKCFKWTLSSQRVGRGGGVMLYMHTSRHCGKLITVYKMVMRILQILMMFKSRYLKLLQQKEQEMPCLFQIHVCVLALHHSFLLLISERDSSVFFLFLFIPPTPTPPQSDLVPILHFNHLLNRQTNDDTKLTLFSGRSFSFVSVVRGENCYLYLCLDN